MSKGNKNVYTCKQGHNTITIDIEDGVTPFMILCEHENCKLMAQSHFYNVSQEDEPTHEWYKPGEEEFASLDNMSMDHVVQGGLLLRGINGVRCKNAEVLIDFVVGIVRNNTEVEVILWPITAKDEADAIRCALIERCTTVHNDIRYYVQNCLQGLSVDNIKTKVKEELKINVEVIKI